MYPFYEVSKIQIVEEGETLEAQGGLPSRVYLPLFTLSQTGSIIGTTKFQKLIFLIQVRAHLTPMPYKYHKHYYGPYSTDLNTDLRLLEQIDAIDVKSDFSIQNRPYAIYRITAKGDHLLNHLLRQKPLQPKRLQRIEQLLQELGPLPYQALLHETYAKYISDQTSFKTLRHKTQESLIALFTLWERRYTPESFLTTLTLAALEYSQFVLQKLSEATDPVHRGVIFACINELLRATDTASLTSPTASSQEPEHSQSEILELLNFLSHYCQENKICPSLENLDASDIMDEEDFKRLQQAFQTDDQSYY